jgi:hypothetical protein
VTVPPAVAVAAVNVAESCTDPPTVIDEAESVVAIVGEAFPTVSCSLVHALVEAPLLASPE